MKSPASAPTPRRSSSPRWDGTCRASPPRRIWCRGPSCAAHHPVRADHPRRQDRQGQPVSQRRTRRGRCGGRPNNTFLGERYRRIVNAAAAQGTGGRRPLILVTVWHLLADPSARFHDLGATTTPAASSPNENCATTSPNSPLGTESRSNRGLNPTHAATSDSPGRCAHWNSRRKSIRTHGVSGAFASARPSA